MTKIRVLQSENVTEPDSTGGRLHRLKFTL
jgi:hypothetical protein